MRASRGERGHKEEQLKVTLLAYHHSGAISCTTIIMHLSIRSASYIMVIIIIAIIIIIILPHHHHAYMSHIHHMCTHPRTQSSDDGGGGRGRVTCVQAADAPHLTTPHTLIQQKLTNICVIKTDFITLSPSSSPISTPSSSYQHHYIMHIIYTHSYNLTL